MKRLLFLLLVMLAVTGCRENPKKRAQAFASQAAYLSNDGKHSDAIPLLKKAISLQPKCVEYHVGLAIAYVKVKNNTLAQEEYEKVLPLLREEARNDPERVDDLVMVLVCLNRQEEAKTVLDNAQTRFKGNQTISMLTDNYDEIVENFSEWAIKE